MEMIRLGQITFASFLLLTSPVFGQDSAVFAPLDLSSAGERDLLVERQALMARLVARVPSGEEEPPSEAAAQLYLDLAELHLAQMLRREAAGLLSVIAVEDLSPEAQRRHRTLQMVLDLLSERDELSAVLSRSIGWEQGQALRTAAFARLDRHAEAARLLPFAIQTLDALSPAIRAAILPDLLEAALFAEAWPEAKVLATRFADHAELRDSPAYRFLLAHAAELSGDLLSAFDGYMRAAEGRDAHAQRARLALVLLGRRTETLSLAEAVETLKAARWAWSGDEVATEVAQYLADYSVEHGDTRAALWALDLLLTEATDPDEAEALRDRARDVLEAFYEAGATGEIALGTYLEDHAVISLRWRFLDGFAERAAVLPQTLLDTGMTALAAREFRTLRDVEEASGEFGQSIPDRAMLLQLSLGEAHALLAGGQAGAAVDVLIPLSARHGGDGDVERLLVEALSQAGRSDELADLRVRGLDFDLQRRRATTLYENAKWAPAHEALLELWDSYPGQFGFSDASRLIRAAHEVGNTDTVSRVATAFPSLSDLPGWSELAVTLKDSRTTPTELDTKLMRSSIENADRVLNAVTEITDSMNRE
ncbi:hypothetical protein DU478_14770 [Thalassococcus profundi]|uniref:Uncharacterized protein n=1 Tax=Thalassococcus profundi TaxID=2282382 RepID=A0A369TJL8_9RHOB|nr:hypothetical protein [Thalassococcus profundi]RDD65430.1 hypothetical protein DU478_14770 [Thalassococcus profundi]